MGAMSAAMTVGVDVGGTKIATALVDDAGRILARERRATIVDDSDALRASLAEAVRAVGAGHDVVAVGVSAAGFVAADRNRMMFGTNLDWGQSPVGDDLAARLGVPVVLENDGNAAAWGEYVHGAGRGVPDQLMVAVGTGVGGGLILGGRIYRGGHGVAAEIGHVGYVPDGHPCPCGRRGCLEQYAAGPALVREAREAAAAGQAPRLLEAAGGDADKIDGHVIAELAAEGVEEALTPYRVTGRILGEGIAGLVAVLDPSLVVLGGGVSTSGEVYRAAVEEALHAHITARGHRPEPDLVVAALGNDAALIGAADLARALVS